MAVPSIGSTRIDYSLGESLSRAKITKMKTIFSPGENQHPALAGAVRSRLTSGRIRLRDFLPPRANAVR
ncbi:hypothetical protein [Mycobacterium mantenii]|uniref:hypothetical protein n=1 Tax=Mycobacterium mantenii TaxID=560555 RepID=UPI000AE9D3A3|nr:hypothetical protein [Mycobacterium mantenii]